MNRTKKARPMAMTPANVLKILGQAKNETRRVINPQPVFERGWWRVGGRHFCTTEDLCDALTAVARWQPGDIVYLSEPVRFTSVDHPGSTARLVYLATNRGRKVALPERVKIPQAGRWRGRVLPIEWARPWRGEILAVRAEPVQEITPEAAICEGCRFPTARGGANPWVNWFADLWDSINRARGRRFADNPWVYVYRFKEAETGT